MHKNFVLTVTGPDRIGIVERVTGLLFERGGNVETSRMARLGGEFAILLLVSMPESGMPALEIDLESLAAEGYKVTTTVDRQDSTVDRPELAAIPDRRRGGRRRRDHSRGRPLSLGTRNQYRVGRLGNEPGPGEWHPALCDESTCGCTTGPGGQGLGGRAHGDRRAPEPGNPCRVI